MKPTSLLTFAAVAILSLAPAFSQNGPAFGPKGPRNQPPTVYAPPSAAEIAALQFMREEEKLARDVYRFLFERWNYSTFERIAASEQQHFEAIGNLLTRHNIPDPAAADLPGVFANPDLATLYAELTAKGAISLKDALEVGVAIETVDIADLETALPGARFDIKRVFTNLMNASLNHLEAFESCLALLTAAN